MSRLAWTMVALLMATGCTPVGTPDPPADPPSATASPGPVPVGLPPSLAPGRTIGYASQGFGYGNVTAEYHITGVDGETGGFVLTYTETVTGDRQDTREGFARFQGEAAFDRGQALSYEFLEATGPETITVPAGVFATMKYVNRDVPKYVQVWIADGVVVRMIQGDVGGDKPGTGQAELAYLR